MTSIGFAQKHSGVVSPRTCGTLPSGAGRIVIEGNLANTGSTDLAAQEFVATGAVDLERLSISTPAVVFAAGSITIGALETLNPVLLISATGDVAVHTAAQPGLISVIAARSVSLPPGAESPALILTPAPSDRFLILGRAEN